MTTQRARRIAWLAPVLAAVLVVAHHIFYPDANAAVWVFSLGFVVYAAVGGLIVSRYPRNPVGWLFCVIGVGFGGGDFMSDYAADPSRPGATVLAVFNTAGGRARWRSSRSRSCCSRPAGTCRRAGAVPALR